MVLLRSLAGRTVNAIGLGCMNLSHAYGVPPVKERAAMLLHRAVDMGVTHFDTAALYGFGRNEELIGDALKSIRKRIFLASKCGITGVEERRLIDGRPDTLKRTCENSLRRLCTDHIDLYYLHRWDRRVPLADSVGALGDLVRAGKIGGIGLSEASATMLRLANREYPISAVQSEYSLWTRNPEIKVLEACREVGAAFVAFSPLGRGFLAGSIRTIKFAEGDIRHPMPRFNQPNYSANKKLLTPLRALCREYDVTLPQLALSWVLSQGQNVHVIPGTTSIPHLRENISTRLLTPDVLELAANLVNERTVKGGRYPEDVQAEVDTEEFEPANKQHNVGRNDGRKQAHYY